MLFTALTAYDVQKIQSGALAAQTGSMEKAAVIGALTLYLDFINLFLFMLRLIGGSRLGVVGPGGSATAARDRVRPSRAPRRPAARGRRATHAGQHADDQPGAGGAGHPQVGR